MEDLVPFSVKAHVAATLCLFVAMFAKIGACLVAVSHADSRTLFAPAYTPGMTVPCLQIFEYIYLYSHLAFADGQSINNIINVSKYRLY